ncbi:MAG: hypothetical protein OXH47_10090 [Paracoccaceae bacterium]|nr:hypothetical protein [Paracoccaceae bacterium]
MPENIDEVLKKIVQEVLAPARIVDLKSERAEDADGDPILRIRVVYRAENNRLDPDKVADVIGYLRDSIKKTTNGLDRFPILSFTTPEEVESLGSL